MRSHVFASWENYYAFISLSLGSNIRETTTTRAGCNPTRLNNLINCNGHASVLFLFNLNQFYDVCQDYIAEEHKRLHKRYSALIVEFYISRLRLAERPAKRESDENCLSRKYQGKLRCTNKIEYSSNVQYRWLYIRRCFNNHIRIL